MPELYVVLKGAMVAVAAMQALGIVASLLTRLRKHSEPGALRTTLSINGVEVPVDRTHPEVMQKLIERFVDLEEKKPARS